MPLSRIQKLSAFVKTLPSLPGVYRMLNAAGVVLYVGKAKNLNHRLKSYFYAKNHSPRIELMLQQVELIETTITRNEVEALILENNLIKSLKPKYNIVFRDDKSYPLIRISQHNYPQIAYYRGPLRKPDQYFGPYPNSHYVKESIQIIQKIFQLRTCTNSTFENRSKPCILYQIQRCSAPCTQKISQQDYQQQVEETVLFLKGKTQNLISNLTEKMNHASEALLFETAARYRDQIFSLSTTQKGQFINSKQYSQANLDILACVTLKEWLCIHWVSVRNGQYVGDKSFIVESIDWGEDPIKKYTENFLAQHYLGRYIPDCIITNFAVPQVIQEALNQQSHRKVLFPTRVVGERKKWLDMAEENAHIALSQRHLTNAGQAERRKRLASLLKIDLLDRIECFDVSHTSGEATVASCVVYENGNMQPSQYRRYNIKAKTHGDDYAALREALTRRYQGSTTTSLLPELVIIDGGKGQINVALSVWDTLGLTIPLIGVAKGVERKPGMETLLMPMMQNRSLRLEPSDPALHLIQTIRDEAHRFAITGHRLRRAKNRRKSKLDEIPMIGAKRKKALLIRFGGLREIEGATIEELMKVEGISRAIATKIHEYFHSVS
ncbi:MAG: excinuclease ABC subunit UvrC [Neisseriaceae bacterium]